MSRDKNRFSAIGSTWVCGTALILVVILTTGGFGDELRPITMAPVAVFDETAAPANVPLMSAPPMPEPASPQPSVPIEPSLPAPGGTVLPPIATRGGEGCCCVDLLNIAPNMIGADFGAGTGDILYSNIPHATFRKIQMPEPAESVLGRQTIADDSSPMPRDRFFFDYNYFYQVPFSPNGDAVHRFTSGFEKTFFDGLVSAEVRLPYGTTLDNDIVVSTGKTVKGITHFHYATDVNDLLLGNVSFGAKALLYRRPDEFAVSAGMLVTVPTAEDLTVTGLLSPLHAPSAALDIKNEAVHIAPYLGALWTPTANLFLQGFLQFDFDANGQKVVLENGASSADLGGLRDQSFVYFDAGIGYWIVRDECFNWAAMFEVHYNASLQRPEGINVSPGQVNLDSANGNINLVDLVIGTNVSVCDNKTVTLAYVFAVGADGDEEFTREIRATFNWYF